jgi:hypothetical protein
MVVQSYAGGYRSIAARHLQGVAKVAVCDERRDPSGRV